MSEMNLLYLAAAWSVLAMLALVVNLKCKTTPAKATTYFSLWICLGVVVVFLVRFTMANN
ncbi:MAG: hypothetical protein JWO15_3521 [Sphingomonadales bacterium]|nr:hypothetical protein [Sphingomonadales bacterium]